MHNRKHFDNSDISQDSDDEDKYSYTVRAGHKVIERTEDQVVQNTKTYRRIIITGTMNNPEMGESESYSRGWSVNYYYRSEEQEEEETTSKQWLNFRAAKNSNMPTETIER
jgi:hypothetical protein